MNIMLENARQILAIVKGAFSGLSFDGTETEVDCALSRSDGETLNCLWLKAMALLSSPGQVDKVNHSEVLCALTEVCGKTKLSRCKIKC